MPADIFPFDLDGVTVLSETEIRHQGRVWRAAKGTVLGQWTLSPSWLRSGANVDAPADAELWEGGDATLEPSVGPAWEGLPYIPSPAYVREQVLRRRAGLPPRERPRLPRDPKGLRKEM